MSVSAGSRFGPYEVIAPIGAGGMGEVYRARDTRLNRTVAIKLLPEHLSNDADFKARFKHEARAISSLQHPHICTLFDIGTENGTDYLVMEYLEGETLAQQLAKGSIAPKDVLRIGAEVAEALERAHRAGIIHRDLKPGNIMVTKSGAKLLDFGLAKPESRSVSSMVGTAPSFTAVTQSLAASPRTTAGTIIGTIQYMSPEQIEGREADARSDIFGLGAVLYEMATGKRAFEGKSQLSLATAILEKDPEPIRSLHPLTPPALEQLVATCLAKDPEQRWQCAADIARQLRLIAATDPLVTSKSPVSRRFQKIPWAIAAAAVLVALALGWYFAAHRTRGPEPVVRAEIAPPEKHSYSFAGDFAGPPAISPDGKKLVFAARGESGRSLWVRSLARDSSVRLAGTDNGSFPFWSPDSNYIAFFAEGKLKRVAADGGPVMDIAPAPNARGGSWGSGNVILFTPHFRDGLYLVSAGGGTPRPVITPAAGKHTSYRWPWFLPDGEHFLYLAFNHENSMAETSGIYFASLDGKVNKFVMPSQAQGQYTSGYLLHHSQSMLVAQPFNASAGTLEGDPTGLAEGVQYDGSVKAAVFSTSNAGILAYQSGAMSRDKEMLWFDRGGHVVGRIGEKNSYLDFSLSGDDRRVAVGVGDPQSNLWIFDVASRRGTRLTFSAGDYIAPLWSPDGKRIAYAFRGGPGGKSREGDSIYVRDGSGAGLPERLLGPGQGASATPLAWSPDGKYIVFNEGSGLSQLKLMAVAVEGEHKAFQVANNSAGQASFSPDGRWLTYDSDELGKFEIFVIPFPRGEGRWQVSTKGGLAPQWGQNGKEILYVDLDQMLLAASVGASGSEVRIGDTRTLFRLPGSTDTTQPFRVAKNGERILVNTTPVNLSQPFTVVVNWTSLVKNDK